MWAQLEREHARALQAKDDEIGKKESELRKLERETQASVEALKQEMMTQAHKHETEQERKEQVLRDYERQMESKVRELLDAERAKHEHAINLLQE